MIESVKALHESWMGEQGSDQVEKMTSPRLSWEPPFPMEFRTSTCPESHLNFFDPWNSEMMLLAFNKTSIVVTSTYFLPTGRAHPSVHEASKNQGKDRGKEWKEGRNEGMHE